MGKNDNLCEGCDNYNHDQDKCNLLLSLHALSYNKQESQRNGNLEKKADYIEQLLFHHSCNFSRYILSFAGRFSNKRALTSRESADIHNDVVCSLMKLNFRKIQPTFNDFRRYVTKMIKSAIHQEHIRTHGPYRCGTCAYFLGGNRCGCPDLKPLPGRQFLQVANDKKPKEVVHSSMLFVEMDDIRDWPGFCSKLGEGKDQATPNPNKRVWELLSKRAQELVRKAAEGNGHGHIHKPEIVQALNEVLDAETFYQEEYFKDVKITPEAEKLFQRKREGLSYHEVRRLNRLLLESSYPNEINKSIKGCSYHYSNFAPPDSFVDLDNIECLEQPQTNQAESALKYMELLGPRQREQAQLIRLLYHGDTIAEIARQVGKQPNTIRKELHGRDKNEEKDGDEREMPYHQAGAIDVFQSIYNNRFFDLERKEKTLWVVVDQRDFSADPMLPPFRKIAHNFSITKREAIERYVRGWDWIKSLAAKGGNGMPKVTGNGSPNGSEPQGSTIQLRKMSKALHPDYYVLLTYAEGDLNREARKLIAGHILICRNCSTELEQIETEILPKIQRPLNPAERLRWLAARLTGRILPARDVVNRSDRSPKSTGEIARGSRWLLPVQMAFGLAVIVMALLSMLVLLKANQNRLNDRVTSLTMEKRELEKEIDGLREQAQKADGASREAQLLKDKNVKLERELAQLHDRNRAFEKPGASNVTPARDPLTILDAAGAIIVGRNVQAIMPKDNSQNINPESAGGPKQVTLPESQAEPVREFATAREITSAESARKAWQAVEEILAEKPEVARGGNDPTLSPDPISPSRTAVRSTGPTLQWKPVPGAKSYRITITDVTSREKSMIEKNSKETQLTLNAGTLQPGHVYSWFVETRLDSKLITQQLLISPATGFWVLEEKALREVEIVDQNFKPMALVRASVYSKYGLYEEALRQVEQLKRDGRPVQKIRADLHRRLGIKQPK